MKKQTTIKENREYRRAYLKGRYAALPCLVVYTLKNHYGKTRIGITTSKKIGNAVCRNRARRVIRAAFESLRDQVRPGLDIVFVARSKTPLVKTSQVLKEMEFLLKKLGGLK